MRVLLFTCTIGAITLGAVYQLVGNRSIEAPPDVLSELNIIAESPDSVLLFAPPTALPEGETAILKDGTAALFAVEKDQSRLEADRSVSVRERMLDSTPPKSDLSYLIYYVYSEVPPAKKPAQVYLESVKDVPVGTPIEEIKRASAVFGLSFSFMKAVAKIESDFDPKQRTGSYIGLFQLSNYEFQKYGTGEITNARDNSAAAAYKFLTEAVLFEWDTHKKPTFSDMYLIHQQGWQGAAEHISHPERIAWKSMCATDEGREKGERWCKRAIWGNTLPTIKKVWKSVDQLTSAAFVSMWQQRVDYLYARYAAAIAEPAQ